MKQTPRRRPTAAALAVMALLAGGRADAAAQQPADTSLAALSARWPRIREQRVRDLLPQAMRRSDLPAWIVIGRENANDPLAPHVGAENAGGTAAFLFFLEGSRVRSVALSPPGEVVALRDVLLHDSVVVVPPDRSVWEMAAERLRARDPARIAVNSSAGMPAADGLSSTQRVELERALGPELAGRLTSSEPLVVEWLSVKTPEEVDILRRAAALTEQLEREAYATVVPGKTRDSDVARFLKRRMAELGVEDAWHPAQNPSVQSGLDRGHSNATDRVIRPGDFIQTDFGIKVGGMWVTDIQRFAYVLAPGETQAPPEALRRWENARRGNRVAFQAMRPGVRGYDVDAAQRKWMREAGSLPVQWSTGHPGGYWAHDVGPRLGGAQTDAPPSGAFVRELRPGQTFAFDGFFTWPLEDGGVRGTKTISVEEMVVITETGAEYLVPPQEELILIPSRR